MDLRRFVPCRTSAQHGGFTLIRRRPSPDCLRTDINRYHLSGHCRNPTLSRTPSRHKCRVAYSARQVGKLTQTPRLCDTFGHPVAYPQPAHRRSVSRCHSPRGVTRGLQLWINLGLAYTYTFDPRQWGMAMGRHWDIARPLRDTRRAVCCVRSVVVRSVVVRSLHFRSGVRAVSRTRNNQSTFGFRRLRFFMSIAYSGAGF